METGPSRERGRFAAIAVRVAALWVLSVSLIKLFKGSPSDLPKVVQDFAGDMDLGLKFQLVCAIELSVVGLCLLRPRWGWPLLAGMFGVFLAILGVLIAHGETSCGCFGGAIKLSPWTMLGLDSACLLAVLASRPWSTLPRSRGSLVPVLAALSVAWLAPFVVFKNAQLPVRPPVDPAPAAVGTNGEQTPRATGTNGAQTTPETAAAKPPPPAWHLPEPLPTFQVLNPEKQHWQGKRLTDTELGALLDVELYPQDAIWILYRITCDHCAQELLAIANDPERKEKLYVLVRIPEPNEEAARQVNQYPPIFQEAILPELPRGYVGETPWTLEVEAGTVKSVRFREGD